MLRLPRRGPAADASARLTQYAPRMSACGAMLPRTACVTLARGKQLVGEWLSRHPDSPDSGFR
jgi:hypothetical protein